MRCRYCESLAYFASGNFTFIRSWAHIGRCKCLVRSARQPSSMAAPIAGNADNHLSFRGYFCGRREHGANPNPRPFCATSAAMQLRIERICVASRLAKRLAADHPAASRQSSTPKNRCIPGSFSQQGTAIFDLRNKSHRKRRPHRGRFPPGLTGPFRQYRITGSEGEPSGPACAGASPAITSRFPCRRSVRPAMPSAARNIPSAVRRSSRVCR